MQQQDLPMPLPKITVITPSLNQAAYLEQTIVSVINQGYPNLEYIVMDGGSTDGSADILKRYEKHLTYWISEKDRGHSDAINKGVKLATGEIINWLNSDDYYEPGALLKIAGAFSDPNTYCVSARSRIFDSATGKSLKISKGSDIYRNNLAKTIGWARMDQPETFFRKSIFENCPPLSTELDFVMDRKLWMDCLFLNGLKGITQIEPIVVNFRIHPQSKTSSKQSLFQVEHDSMFYALAHQYSLVNYGKIIRDIFTIKTFQDFSFPSGQAPQFIETVLTYYLLLRGIEMYAGNKKEKAEFIFSQIKPGLLSAQDKSLLKKIQFRNKYIPRPILNFARHPFGK